MTIIEEACFRLAKNLVVRRDRNLQKVAEAPDNYKRAIAGATPATFDRSKYKQWRKSELIQQFDDHFTGDIINGKRVLDFGCGFGELSLHIAQFGAKSIDGTDLDGDAIKQAEETAAGEELLVRPQFKTGTTTQIPFPNESFDLILCFDVLEHISSIEQIVIEWKRVLTNGGKIGIWWQPYFHPYGHHLMAYMPIPWAHVFFSEKTLGVACKKIYEMPGYIPRYWDLDENGKKRDRGFRIGAEPLTVSKFEAVLKSNGLRIARREAHSFSGPWIVQKISSLCSQLPFLNEFFTAYMIYEIEKAA